VGRGRDRDGVNKNRPLAIINISLAFKSGKMAGKVCEACGVKLRKKTTPVVVDRCRHAFCTACARERCVFAINNHGDEADELEPFKGACCSCGSEIPLEAVKGVLECDEFLKYERVWTASRVTCISCSTVVFKGSTRSVPCGHKYCCECIRRMCRLTLGDRALVPVRCCRKEFPLEWIRESLDEDEFEMYLQMLKEREKDWRGSDLLSDTEYAESVRLLGAKHCPGCGIGVERDFGCIHMKCPIGHEFCFSCLRLWRSCNCPLLPEEEVRQILGEG
jgi:hypothetical protein